MGKGKEASTNKLAAKIEADEKVLDRDLHFNHIHAAEQALGKLMDDAHGASAEVMAKVIADDGAANATSFLVQDKNAVAVGPGAKNRLDAEKAVQEHLSKMDHQLMKHGKGTVIALVEQDAVVLTMSLNDHISTQFLMENLQEARKCNHKYGAKAYVDMVNHLLVGHDVKLKLFNNERSCCVVHDDGTSLMNQTADGTSKVELKFDF